MTDSDCTKNTSKYYAIGLKIAGSRMGRWQISNSPPEKMLSHYYIPCICLCGKEKLVRIEKLARGGTKSCGCGRDKNLTTHGKTTKENRQNSRSYWIWNSMKQRCLNPNNKGYANYGGRGITVCDKWMQFEGFYADMGDKPKDGMLERIDNDAGYSPENCCWASRITQNRNKRNSRIIHADGQARTLAEWAAILDMTHSAILARISRGWTEADAVTTAKRSKPLR